MSDQTYNGWANYQTWVVNLWLTNDSGSDEHLRSMARDCLTHLDGDIDDAVYELAKRIEEDHEEFMPETTGVYSDLLGHALRMVDWREIAQHVIDEEYEDWREDNPEEETATDETRANGPY
jgi:hypothetical protein